MKTIEQIENLKKGGAIMTNITITKKSNYIDVLVPKAWGSNGLVLEYNLLTIKNDKRTLEYKRYARYQFNTLKLIKAITQTDTIIKENRIILKSGQDAYDFKIILKK